MKIAIICDVLGKENNGTTVAAMNLIRSLKAKGHEVRVVCPDEDRRGDEGFYIVKKINFGIFNDYVEENGVVISRPDEDMLRTVIQGADVCHLVTPFFLAHKGMEIAREYGVPITASFHCQAENISSHLFLMNSTRFNTKIYKTLYSYIYRYCTAVHYPTQFICDVFERECGHTTNHYVISNGVGKEFVRHPEPKPAEFADKKVVLFTGRYSREKCHKVLIDAVALTRDPGRIKLVFAGCGPLDEKLHEYAREVLPADDQPLFGFFSRPDMLRVLNYADLYVHPAEIEIEAIACLEAIKCGLVPVIADSPRSATRYFALGEKNLFKYDSPEELASRIDYWLDDPEAMERCRRAYEGYSAQFDRDYAWTVWRACSATPRQQNKYFAKQNISYGVSKYIISQYVYRLHVSADHATVQERSFSWLFSQKKRNPPRLSGLSNSPTKKTTILPRGSAMPQPLTAATAILTARRGSSRPSCFTA